VPEEKVEVRGIKLESDLAYEEKPMVVLEVKERVTQNRVVKLYKVVWSNHLRDNHPNFYTKWYAFQISG
jgi:hypothetical protein